MSTRSHKKPTDIPISPKITRKVESSWILFGKNKLLNNSNFTIISLPHPTSGERTKYCLDSSNNKIYEIITYDEPYRSWFIGDTVKSDGSIQILSPINPLFLILPRLREQCTNKVIPLEDLLSEKGFDKIKDFITNLDRVADLKGPVDIAAYKYNEAKTLDWLEDRVLKVAKVLKEKNIHVTSGSTSATFVSSNIDSVNTREDIELYLKYAHELVSEYLQEDLASSLEKRFNFEPKLMETLAKKRKSEPDDDTISVFKKIKSESNNDDAIEMITCSPIIDIIENKKPLTAKEKARQRAASGTKSISSFFKNVGT